MKKVVCLLLTMILLITVIPPLTVSADSTYTKKVVSILYDDSGSMNQDGNTAWAYANYAMQYFCGALNEGDQLFITYMSDYTHTEIPAGFDSDRQSAINSIQNHVASSSTPYDAIEYATKAFNKVSDYDANTQFWLVIITDGNFSEGIFDISKAQLDSKLHEISAETMPNGSNPVIEFFAIGQNVTLPDEDADNNIFVAHAKTENEIVGELSDIADKVSGRYRTTVTQIDDHTIEFSSDIPLINISLVLQGASADISGVWVDNHLLEVTSLYKLGEPKGDDSWNRDGVEKLKCTLAMINNGGENIPAGTYRIEFSDSLSANDIDVLLEPALELKLSLFKEDTLISDPSALYSGDTINIVCDIYEMGTQNEIDPKYISSDSIKLIEATSDSQTATSDSFMLDGYTLSFCETKVFASLQMNGVAPITASLVFTPREPAVFGIEVVSGGDITIAKPDLPKNERGVLFVLTVNGVPATPEEAVGHKFTAESKLKIEIEQLDDGSYLVVPKSTWPIIFNPKGKILITGTIDGQHSTDAFVEITAGSFWVYFINTLYWFVPLLVILWLLSVKHFMPCTIKCECVEFDRNDRLSDKYMSSRSIDARTDFFGSPIARIKPRVLMYVLRESVDSFTGIQFKAGGSSKVIWPWLIFRRGKTVEVLGTSLSEKLVSFGGANRLSEDDYETEYIRLKDSEPRSQNVSFNETLTNRTMFVMLSNEDRTMYVFTVSYKK